MSERIMGTTKWFNGSKGYGFIKVDESEMEVFVHYSELQGEGVRSLSEGQRVEFSIVRDSKERPSASNVVAL